MAVKKLKQESLSAQHPVVDYLNKLQHPLKSEIEAVRKLILSANTQLTEQIKWNAPSFCFDGDDRITFNLHGKDAFQLVFHCGVKAKNKKLKGRLPEDYAGLLEWASDDRAIMKLGNMQDVKAKQEALVKTVKDWIVLSTDSKN